MRDPGRSHVLSTPRRGCRHGDTSAPRRLVAAPGPLAVRYVGCRLTDPRVRPRRSRDALPTRLNYLAELLAAAARHAVCRSAACLSAASGRRAQARSVVSS